MHDRVGDTAIVLVPVLGDHSQQAKVRMAAARALGAIGDTRAVEPLMVALDHDPDGNVRIVAAWALEPLGVPRMEVRAQSTWVALGAARARMTSGASVTQRWRRPEDIPPSVSH